MNGAWTRYFKILRPRLGPYYSRLSLALGLVLEDIVKEAWVLALSNQVKSFISTHHGQEVESRGGAVICWLGMLLKDLRLASQVSLRRTHKFFNTLEWFSPSNLHMDHHPPASQHDTDLLPHIKQLTLIQWGMIIWQNLQNLLLFYLSIIYIILDRCGLMSARGTGQYVVEKELEQISSTWKSEDASDDNLDAAIQTLLGKYKEGSAIWHDVPWVNAWEMHKEILHGGLSRLNGKLIPHSTEPTINCNSKKLSISAFQDYITTRIELHARLVEWAYLGSATRVQAELKQKMAEIWKIIRDDVRALPSIPTPFVGPSPPPDSGPLLAGSQQQELPFVLASDSTDTVAPSVLDSSPGSSSPPVIPSTEPRPPPGAGSPGRWAPWIPDSRQHSTDSLANWEAKVKAKVDWSESSYRLPNNEIVHKVVPYLTCIKCHALPSPNHDIHPLAFDFQGLDHMNITSESLTQQWANKHPNYELVGYWPNVELEAGRQIVSILVCYRLNHLPITDCFGEGRSLKAARTQAAEKLLRSGHCMIRLA
ncbi:unnamed protein product [Rhizoctonia solani]|uniref:Uncharacterized protein n=1 Tax=Rhizoctonia solani TaxID=456999 RepID=A0A8H3BP47_9AGAM|nr:unnamed protein product [Rhizoctonia solani]